MIGGSHATALRTNGLNRTANNCLFSRFHRLLQQHLAVVHTGVAGAATFLAATAGAVMAAVRNAFDFVDGLFDRLLLADLFTNVLRLFARLALGLIFAAELAGPSPSRKTDSH
jgi:ABC-type uncharacterized transport system YnjBCD permease subunit